MRPKTLERQLADHTAACQNGCLEWSGSRNRKGYGSLRSKGKTLTAHRVAWQVAHGEIPVGMMVLHKCDNPPWFNVEHLYLGTAKDNALDMERKGRQRGRFTKGQRNPRRKLTDAQLEHIRSAYRSGEMKQVELAEMYNTRQGHISNIITGRAKYNKEEDQCIR